MLALVLSGGELEPSPRLLELVAGAELVIAADSGARHAAALGCRLDVVLGDFDSWHVATRGGAEVLTYPTAKDQTDTHLAVREAVRRGATEIALLGALRGPRLDHAAANIALLCAREFARVDLRAVDGADELRAVRSSTVIAGAPGDLVTLLAVTDHADGVVTEGLRYPLRGETLRRGDSRGVSNELAQDRAEVHLRRGVLLLVHRRGGDPNRLG